MGVYSGREELPNAGGEANSRPRLVDRNAAERNAGTRVQRGIQITREGTGMMLCGDALQS